MGVFQPNPQPGEDQVTADFFTVNFRFTATVVVRQQRLVDVLSDSRTNYLRLIDIYASRINEPAKIVSTYPGGTLAKEKIIFVLLPTKVEGIIKEQRFYTPTQDVFSIFITVPSFNIYGKLRGKRTVDIATILTGEEQKFLPIFDVTAYNSLVPDIDFKGPIALVNKAEVEILCADDSA
jgi:hypothetical protein